MHSVRLLDDPIEGWYARIDAIRSAKKSILVEYYAFHMGPAAYTFIGMLVQAAQRGVKVRMLVSKSSGLSSGIIAFLSSLDNLVVRFYAYPVDPSKPSTWTKQLHDKIVLTDGTQVITGGRNIGDKYYGRDDLVDYLTLDRDIIIHSESGGVVKEVEDYFEQMWSSEFATRKNEQRAMNENFDGYGPLSEQYVSYIHKAAKKAADEMYAQVKQAIKEHPDWFSTERKYQYPQRKVKKIVFSHDEIYDKREETGTAPALYDAFLNAKSSIEGQSPYIITTDKMLEVFQEVCKKDVKFSLVTNGLACSPNIMAVSGYLYDRETLLNSGMELAEYQGPDNVHHKSFVIDESIAIVGSFNLDPRSANINTEMMYFIHSKSFSNDLLNAMRFHGKRALLVMPDGTLETGGLKAAPVSGFKKAGTWFVQLFVPYIRGFL